MSQRLSLNQTVEIVTNYDSEEDNEISDLYDSDDAYESEERPESDSSSDNNESNELQPSISTANRGSNRRGRARGHARGARHSTQVQRRQEEQAAVENNWKSDDEDDEPEQIEFSGAPGVKKRPQGSSTPFSYFKHLDPPVELSPNIRFSPSYNTTPLKSFRGELVSYYRLTPSQRVQLSQGDTHFKVHSLQNKTWIVKRIWFDFSYN